jgi:gluconate 2-dehydrogenase gamma chain
MSQIISRRDLLKRAAAVGAATALSSTPLSTDAAVTATDAAAMAFPGQLREPIENLTAAESDVLDAIVARLIPTDDKGPGATEARAAHYIDRALGGALAASRDAYRTGLTAVDRYARSSRGKPFVELSPADQDSVLRDVEAGAATSGSGFAGSSTVFFNLVRAHTLQGTFGDPYYGGNANFIGWDMLGYPGVRTAVTQDEQQMNTKVTPNHKSAYDYTMFVKATARAASHDETTHGE